MKPATRGRIVWAIWLALWCAIALVTGYAASDAGNDPSIAAIAGLGVGQVMALLAMYARRISRERGYEIIPFHTFRLVPLWCMFWFGLAAISGWAIGDDFRSSMHHNFNYLLGVPGILISGLFARSTARNGTYLRVDVAAGVVEFVRPVKAPPLACTFAQLPMLQITLKHTRTGRHTATEYHVVAPGCFEDRTLWESFSERGARRLLDRMQYRLEVLRDRAAVYRILVDAPAEGSAFREGPDLAATVQAALPDPARRRHALGVLANDDNADVRAAANKLLTA